jgi:nuclear pore complex protein Nup50
MMQFRNKRIMEGSLFDVHRAEPSQQLMGETPQLDMKRAESSQQHVRALNTQFARFIFNLMSTNLLFLDLCISVF